MTLFPLKGKVPMQNIEKTTGGFTMPELIVVCGIIVVLVALAVPMAGKLSGQREDMVCVSNLRQIGTGILAYASDHNGSLPGPLNHGQYAYWSGGDRTQLSSLLLDYLEVNPQANKTSREDVFVCPAHRRQVRRLSDAPSLAVNVYVPFESGNTVQPPFGYVHSRTPKMFNKPSGTPDTPPMKLVNLLEMNDGQPGARARTWAIQDIDQQHDYILALKPPYASKLPPAPAHGSHRNSLFFDFHVEKTPIETTTTTQ